MVRKQNKIQGVVSDEVLAQWEQWKQEQGFKSDGQALNALLVQFFSSGETDITSDKALRDRIYKLEQQITQTSHLSEIQDDLSQKGKQIEALEEKLKDLEKQLSQYISFDKSHDIKSDKQAEQHERDRLQNPKKDIAEEAYKKSSDMEDCSKAVLSFNSEGISQRKLAKELGIDRSYITKWQRGKKPDPKAKPKTKEAYEKWKQWYLGEDDLWYRRNE